MITTSKTFKVILFTLLLVPTISLFADEPTRPKRERPKQPNRSVEANKLILKGSIKGPREWDIIPEFRVIFEGKQTISDEEGFYSFNLENWKLDKFKVLICKNLHQNFDSINTIENLKLIPDKTYKYFSFKKTINEKKQVTWIQTEKTQENKNFIVPKNCLVILMNPKYVESVDNWDIKLADNFVALPQITLKDSYPEKRIRREAAKSLLRSLDLATFHEKTERQKKVSQSNIQLSLAQN